MDSISEPQHCGEAMYCDMFDEETERYLMYCAVCDYERWMEFVDGVWR